MWVMTNFNDRISGDVPVLVEFFATWCPHCQRMMPRIEKLKKQMSGRLKVVQLDIDSPANRKPIDHFRVEGVPTFILFKDAKQVWRDSGERTFDELITAIEGHIRPCTRQILKQKTPAPPKQARMFLCKDYANLPNIVSHSRVCV
jgi:thioredoxin 1